MDPAAKAAKGSSFDIGGLLLGTRWCSTTNAEFSAETAVPIPLLTPVPGSLGEGGTPNSRSCLKHA
jgi:hypothetical protein